MLTSIDAIVAASTVSKGGLAHEILWPERGKIGAAEG
jgi:hypothetical protein